MKKKKKKEKETIIFVDDPLADARDIIASVEPMPEHVQDIMEDNELCEPDGANYFPDPDALYEEKCEGEVGETTEPNTDE